MNRGPLGNRDAIRDEIELYLEAKPETAHVEDTDGGDIAAIRHNLDVMIKVEPSSLDRQPTPDKAMLFEERYYEWNEQRERGISKQSTESRCNLFARHP